MIANSKFIFLMIIISFLACKNENELWRVPIGYQNYKISLGDSYEEVIEKIGELKLDVNSENSEDVKNYLMIPNQIKIEKLKINSIVFMRFNRDELVRFETVYTVDEVINFVDFQKIIEKLGGKELTKIGELANTKSKSVANNKELWLRRIDIDTTSGGYSKIRYRVQAIP